MSGIDFDVDLNDVDPNDVGGFQRPQEGRYHVSIYSFSAFGKNGKHFVDFEILAGEPADQKGMKHREYYDPNHEVGKKKLLQLAYAARITTPDRLKKAKEEGRPAPFNSETFETREVVIVCKESEDKKYLNAVGVYDIDDDKVKDVPKNEEFAKRFRQYYPVLEPLGNDDTKPATQQAETPKPEPAASNNVADTDIPF